MIQTTLVATIAVSCLAWVLALVVFRRQAALLTRAWLISLARRDADIMTGAGKEPCRAYALQHDTVQAHC
jgi:hypothetical protein